MSDGPIRLVVFDWAGTLVDPGSRAPVAALRAAFETQVGLVPDDATLRAPMGTHKREHVAQLLALPEVRTRLPGRLRALAPPERVERVLAAFTAHLLECLPAHAQPIDGAVQTLQWLRANGIAVGSCTGYTRAMMERLLPAARAAGLDIDVVVCADEVPQGRPAPWACFRIAERLGIYPLSQAMKVGDTPADVAEGRNAGMVTVAVTDTGNEAGPCAAVRLADADHLLPGVGALPALIERLAMSAADRR